MMFTHDATLAQSRPKVLALRQRPRPDAHDGTPCASGQVVYFGRPPALAEPDGCLALLPRHRLADGRLCGAALIDAGAAAGGSPPTQGAWLLRAACLEARAWHVTGLADHLQVSVALPRGATRAGNLVAQLRAALADAGLDPAAIEVAFTEADLADSGPELLLLLSAIRDTGAGVALDGLAHIPTGLRALRRLPLTGIRLHAGVTADVASCGDSRALAEHVITLAHRTGASVTAGAVHTPMQRAVLADLGCDAAEGPLFAPAMPPAAFHRALAALAQPAH